MIFIIIYSIILTFLILRMCSTVDFNKYPTCSSNWQAHNMIVTIKKINPKNFIKDIKCGIHSNFRICDILFFISFWKIVDFIDMFWYKKHTLTIKYHKWSDKHVPDRGYVACPICVIRKATARNVHECHCGKNKEVV